MSKIYEALEHAEKELKGLEKPISSSPHFPIPTSSHDVLGLEMEEEMIRLYQNIESLLPGSKKAVIQFIGSREGRGHPQ